MADIKDPKLIAPELVSILPITTDVPLLGSAYIGETAIFGSSDYNSDIEFLQNANEIIRFDADGNIYIQGRLVEKDTELMNAFRRFFGLDEKPIIQPKEQEQQSPTNDNGIPPIIFVE